MWVTDDRALTATNVRDAVGGTNILDEVQMRREQLRQYCIILILLYNY